MRTRSLPRFNLETIMLLSLLAITALAYVLHWGFTVDDAAITFSYARNFAAGYGLGALYPGAARVAGYSNLLWVVLLGVGTWLVKDTVLVSKILGLVFALGSVGFLYLSLRGFVRYRWLLIGIILLPLSLTFSFWSVSGLENSFYTCLILAGVYLLLLEDSRQQSTPFGSPLVFLLTGMTRPEGVIYGLAGFGYKLLQLALRWSKETRVQRRQALRHVLIWSAIFFGGYILFRAWHYAYFAYLWPNPIYAKSGWYSVDLHSIWFDPQGWTYLRGYFRTFAAGWMLPAVLFGALVSLRGPQRIFVIFALAALVLPLYTPDWMVNYRFMYPFLPFQTALVILAADFLLSWIGTIRLGKDASETVEQKPAWVRITALLLAVVFAFGVFRFLWANIRLTQRQLACGYEPMAELACMDGRMYWSMSEIDEGYQELVSYAHTAGVDDPLYLIPDIGATSYLENMRILDLAGLADIHIARASTGDQLKQYLFQEQKPAFIVIQGIWARRTDLASFAALYENYLPLNPKTSLENPGQGTFIRKDLLVISERSLVDEMSFTSAEIASGLDLLGVAHQDVYKPGYEGNLETYWQVSTPTGVDWGARLRLRDSEGNVVHEQLEPLGYGWYPTSLWQPRAIIRQHFNLPADLAEGSYTLEINAMDEQAQPVGSAKIEEAIVVDAALAQAHVASLNQSAGASLAVGNPLDGVTLYEESLAIDPDQPEIQLPLQDAAVQAELQLLETARSHWAAGDLDRLVEASQEAAELRNRQPAMPEWVHFGRELRRAGASAASGGNRYDAYRLYLAASQANPGDAWAQRGLEQARTQYLLDPRMAAPAG